MLGNPTTPVRKPNPSNPHLQEAWPGQRPPLGSKGSRGAPPQRGRPGGTPHKPHLESGKLMDEGISDGLDLRRDDREHGGVDPVELIEAAPGPALCEARENLPHGLDKSVPMETLSQWNQTALGLPGEQPTRRRPTKGLSGSTAVGRLPLAGFHTIGILTSQLQGSGVLLKYRKI